MKKILKIYIAVFILFSASLHAEEQPQTQKTTVKNIILLIPDGMSPQAAALTRLYKGKNLTIDKYACAMVKTCSSDGPVTDSSAAASAMATGFKTNSGFVSCLPETAGMPGISFNQTAKKAPVATILEAAKLAGKAAGIVTTSYVQHATPASFSCHYPDRNSYEILAEQQVYLGLDVVLGGGHSFLNGRNDKEDLTKVLEKAGYDYVIWPGRMRSSTSAKLWGMFAPKDLKYEFDRNKEAEPSLAEMTEKAIEILSKDPDGFFLMIEGGKIDYAAHANDPTGVISDVLAFDAAAAHAFDYAEKNMDTVVIAASDHCTGGLAIGNEDSPCITPLQDYLEPLKRAKVTGEGLFKQLFKDRSNLKQVMKDYFGITGLTSWEEATLIVAPQDRFNYAAGPIISNRSHISWSTKGHTGDDVTLYCFDPRGTEPKGTIDNTEIATYMEKALGLNLKKTTEELFVPVSKSGVSLTAKASFADEYNPVLKISKNNKTAELPVNKNMIIADNKTYSFKGITVYNGNEWFVPAKALEMAEEILK